VPQENDTMKNLLKIAVVLPGLIFCFNVFAQDIMPLPDPYLDSWSFTMTNWESDEGYAPIAYTNIICDESAWSSDDGILDCNGLILDSTNAAFLNYKTVEDDGHTNLSCTAGTIWFWFSPDWDSESQGGTGPGDWGRFIDVGAYTTNATSQWWSLLLSPDGNNIYFSGQTNGAGTNYLNAPISWTAGSWHLIGLTYTATNSILYIDDQVATNGIGVIYPPNHNVLTNGFNIGSDRLSGTQQARGEFVDVESWNMIFPSDEFSAYYDEMLPELPGSFGGFGGGFADSFGGVGGFSGGGSSSGGIPSFVDGTNLWLQITRTTNTGTSQTAYFTIWPPTGVTNSVYDLFYTTNLATDVSGLNGTNWAWVLRSGAGETNLTVTNLTADNNFFQLGLTNDTDGDGLSDAFERLVSHTDPNNADQNTNGIPDGWEWNYFGSLNLSSNADYDGDGHTILYDYQNGIDPNIIQFSIEATNDYFNTANAPVSLNVANGVPSNYAVSVDDTNYATDAGWQAYAGTNLPVNLGTNEGWHDVWIGLKGLPASATQTWRYIRLKLDFTAPSLAVTSTTNASGTVNVPVIQLTGYSSEALSGIAYGISNAAGVATSQPVMITGQSYDTDTAEFTTNWFQGYDVPLTNGLNLITLRAMDEAGNMTTTNFSLTLDYSGKTNPPVMQLLWPQDGMEICGSNIICRGIVSDPTATVGVQLVDASGATNTAGSRVGRDGMFYADNLTLAAGTNHLSFTVTDAAGNTATTNITVMTSSLNLTLNPVSAGQTLVTGTIDDTNYTVYVNGVQATNNGGGTWSAQITPIGVGGGAVVVNAVAGGDPSLQQIVEPPQGLFVSSYHMAVAESDFWDSQSNVDVVNWQDGQGGDEGSYWDGGLGGETISNWWAVTSWPQALPWSTGTFTYPPPFGQEHCDFFIHGVYTFNGFVWGERSTADIEMKLATGGPPGSTQQNLWVITATAKDKTTSQPIPPQQISIGGFGNLDSNSNLFVMLPDNDPDTVTPKVNGNNNYSFTINAQKYKLVTYTEYPALSNTNRNRTTIGVAEQVDLSFNPTMPFAMDWTTTAGGLSATFDSSTTFTAPSNATPNVTVTATLRGGKSVTFPPFNVVEPAGIDHAQIIGTNSYPLGAAGAGMINEVWIAPTYVSFYRVNVMEVGEDATNIYGFFDDTNYFTTNPASQLHHSTADKWTHLNSDNALSDDAAIHSGGYLPWAAGGYGWNIPQRWQVDGSGVTNSMTGIYSSFQIDSNGTTTSSKYGNWIQRTTNNVITTN
jgi:thrombospondin type 3 repeat protein